MSKFLEVKNNARAPSTPSSPGPTTELQRPADWATACWQGVFRRTRASATTSDYRNFGKGLQLVSTATRRPRIDSKFREDMMPRCSRFSSESEIDDCRVRPDAFYYALRASGKSWTAFTGKRCIAGKFCIFDDKSYEDRRAAMTVSHSNLNDDGLGFGDKTSSARERRADVGLGAVRRHRLLRPRLLLQARRHPGRTRPAHLRGQGVLGEAR